MPRVITYHTYLTGMNTLLTLSLFERPLHATLHAMNYATAAPATAGGQQNGPVSENFIGRVARHFRISSRALSLIDNR